MEDRQRKNEAIASSIGIYNIELAHEKMEITVPNNPGLTFYYSSKMSVHVMEKKLLAVIDLANETISYLVEMTEDSNSTTKNVGKKHSPHQASISKQSH